MHILLYPVGLILWYLAYESKPIINDEVTLNWKEKNINKRNKLLNIIKTAFKIYCQSILTIPCAYNLDLRLAVSDK